MLSVRAGAARSVTLALACAMLVACGGSAQPSPVEWAARTCEVTDTYDDATAAALSNDPAPTNRTLGEWQTYASRVAPGLAAAAQTASDGLRDIDPAAGAENYHQALSDIMAVLVTHHTNVIDLVGRAQSASEIEVALIAAGSAALEAAADRLQTAGRQLPETIRTALDARCGLGLFE